MIDIEALLPPHKARAVGAPHILEGVLVVDFTHYLAGPLATMMLADLGATVIKLEKPGRGDDFRHYPPMHPDLQQQGAPFVWCNRNKKSIALNMKARGAKEIIENLIAKADVVVENFSTGVTQRLGFDYEACKKMNPAVIYCSISAYGRKGEFADRNGYDPVTQAESGFMSTNGYGDRDGVRTTTPVIDVHTGTLAYGSILAALYHRERSGEGQYIEMSLYESAVQMTGYSGMQYLFTGKDIGRNANVSPDICPAAVFKCKDRSFYINCGNDAQFKKLVGHVMGREDLATNKNYERGSDRLARRDELMSILQQDFEKQPWSYWGPRIRKSGVPCGEVRRISDQIVAKESRELNIHSRIPHPQAGWIPNFAPPVSFSLTPTADPQVSPSVGEHTDIVLKSVLGYGNDVVEQLRQEGTFGESLVDGAAQI
ncbi:CaiB/BaiF CoA transferase family protein [Bordetella tumulicola]